MDRRDCRKSLSCQGFSRAFTLVEMLVVIGIIVILIAASLVVGHHVVGGGKVRATADTLRLLDTALANYIQEKGEIPPPTLDHPVATVTNRYPVADATFGAGVTIDTVGMFIQQAQSSSSAKAAVERLQSKFTRMYDPDGGAANAANSLPPLNSVIDAWGNPIRYVHPVFDGIIDPAENVSAMIGNAPAGRTYYPQTIQRSGTNSDLGVCLSNRPYFYSCGPDGRPETTGDNVYVVTPPFASN